MGTIHDSMAEQGLVRPLDGRVVFLLTALMALLAVTTIVLVLAAV